MHAAYAAAKWAVPLCYVKPNGPVCGTERAYTPWLFVLLEVKLDAEIQYLDFVATGCL